MKARLPKEYQPRSQADLMRQAQEMQESMSALQAKLEESEYTAQSNGSAVSATVNGKYELTGLDISPELIADAAEDKEMLEDFVMMAVNAAVKQARDASDGEMGKITQGFNIPGMF